MRELNRVNLIKTKGQRKKMKNKCREGRQKKIDRDRREKWRELIEKTEQRKGNREEGSEGKWNREN